MAVGIAKIYLKVLGPVEIWIISGQSRERLRVTLGRYDEMFVRALAAHPDGFDSRALMGYFPISKPRSVHDSSLKLRKLLREHDFELTNGRPSYQILHEGTLAAIESDLELLSKSGELVDEFGSQDWKRVPPEATILLGDLKRLDLIVECWSSASSSSRPSRQARASMLGDLDDSERSRRLVDLDDAIRFERARRAVAFVEHNPSTPGVERARRTIAEYDAPHEAHPAHQARLSARLRKIAESLSTQERGTTDVFLAAPMEAADDYAEGRSAAADIIDALRAHCDVDTVFFAGDTISDPDHFENPSVGLGRNMPYFRSATRFVMVYPEKVASGVLVEAGLALALGASAVYFVKNRQSLPWILRDTSGANDMKLGPVRIIEYRDHADLLAQIRTSGLHLFPPARS